MQNKFSAQLVGVGILSVLMVVPCSLGMVMDDQERSVLFIMLGSASFTLGYIGFILYLKKHSDRGSFPLLVFYILFYWIFYFIDFCRKTPFL